MPQAGFETAIPGSVRLQTHAFDRGHWDRRGWSHIPDLHEEGVD